MRAFGCCNPRRLARYTPLPPRVLHQTYLDFEKPLADIEGKAEELRAMARKGDGTLDIEKEAQRRWTASPPTCCADLDKTLDPWRKTPGRPPSRPPALPATISPHCSANTRPWPATARSATTMR